MIITRNEGEKKFDFIVRFQDEKLNDDDMFSLVMDKNEMKISNEYLERKMVLKDLFKKSYLEKRFEPLIYDLINEYHMTKKFMLGRKATEKVQNCEDFFRVVLPTSLRNV